MDDSIAGPEYSAARAARKDAYATDKAFDVGEALAKPGKQFDALGEAAKVEAAKKSAMAQGYGATMGERLLGRNATPGALNQLAVPTGKEAASAALGPDALAKSLLRERAFNQSVQQGIYGSPTARFQSDIAGAVGDAASAMHGNPLGLLRRGADMVARKATTKKAAERAPYIAEALMKRGVPSSSPIPTGAVEQAIKNNPELLSRILLGMGAYGMAGAQ
jgi:hypothetical protein